MFEKILSALLLAGVVAYVIDLRRKLNNQIAHARALASAAHNLALYAADRCSLKKSGKDVTRDDRRYN